MGLWDLISRGFINVSTCSADGWTDNTVECIGGWYFGDVFIGISVSIGDLGPYGGFGFGAMSGVWFMHLCIEMVSSTSEGTNQVLRSPTH